MLGKSQQLPHTNMKNIHILRLDLKAIRAIKAQDLIDHGGSDHPWTRETSGCFFFKRFVWQLAKLKKVGPFKVKVLEAKKKPEKRKCMKMHPQVNQQPPERVTPPGKLT